MTSTVRITIWIPILLLGIFAAQPSAQEKVDFESPRLRSLAAQFENGKQQALNEFWAEMETNTTPLIEPIDGDPNHVWLTVLWRGDENTHNVLLVGGLVRGNSFDNTLHQFLDTDVWYLTYRMRTDLRATYRFSPNDPLVMVPMDDAEAVAKQRANHRRDPLNPNSRGASLIELPDAPRQIWTESNKDAPRGKMHTEKAFKSEILGNERIISVYLPPEYDPVATPYPMFLVFDQSTYVTVVPTPRILNHLIHAKKIPPMVAVFVGNVSADARNIELPCNDSFVQFLATELIPWVHEKYNVSTDPTQNVVAGSSFGGLAASYVAFRHPELFGNVISQSGSYWWSPNTNSSFLAHEVEGEWLTRQYAEAGKKTIRFFLEVGLNEGGKPTMVIVNRHFRDVLIAKGYEIVKYDEFNGGHSTLNWRGSLADGLIALIGY
jgi:enterochelin esterase family protein